MQNLKESKKFLRQCISCRLLKQKQELIRITKDYKTEEVLINNNSKVNGRSAYVCKNSECIKIAIKKKKIEHSIKSNLSENIKKELFEQIL